MKDQFKPLNNSNLVLAYFAGIIDGEGSITASDNRISQKKMHFSTQLCLSTTDLPLIEWIIKHFGGKYKEYTPAQYSCKSRRRVYKWSATGKRLEYILQAVMPYLVIKKREAEVMLIMRETFKKEHRTYVKQKNNHACYPKLNDGVLEKRLWCLKELRKLHCRNYNTYKGSHSTNQKKK